MSGDNGRRRLNEAFARLDDVPMLPELAERLHASLRPSPPHRWASLTAGAAVVAATAFALGRLSVPLAAPMATLAEPTTTPLATTSIRNVVVAPRLVDASRDGDLLVLRIADVAGSESDLATARLRLADGATLLPEAVGREPDGLTRLAFRVPARRSPLGVEASLELNLGTGTWVQRLPSP